MSKDSRIYVVNWENKHGNQGTSEFGNLGELAMFIELSPARGTSILRIQEVRELKLEVVTETKKYIYLNGEIIATKTSTD